jgi:gliding motility-associated-like protein
MNHGFQLLHTLYSSAFGKYAKFRHRFDKVVQSGKFKKLSRGKQSSLISRLRKLYERLKSLQTQLRLAGAGAAFSLVAAFSNPVSAQTGLGPFERNNAANPLPPPNFVIHPRVAVVDIDNDGDVDSFIGNSDGNIQFFRNDSPDGQITRLIEIKGTDNPLDGVNMGYHAAPAFADVDGDGDFDLLLGTYYNYTLNKNTFYFKNTGTATNPVFTEQTGASNPFDGITGTNNKYGTSLAIPVFVNLDGDADLDLFIGSSERSDVYGTYDAIQYFENQGTVTVPNFVSASHSIITDLNIYSNAALTFADMDGDGDLDLFAGQYYGSIRAFRNTSGTFTSVPDSYSPIPYYYFRFGSPAFADMDGDDDLDLIVGRSTYSSSNPSLTYYENDGEFDFVRNNALNQSPFGGVDVGYEAAPFFTDIDNDGDLDALIGAKYSNNAISVYINTEGYFIADPDHPLTDFVEFENVVPTFVDIDDDGDMDLFYGGYSVSFFKNTGSASDPIFTEQDDLFPGLHGDNSTDLSVAFIDVDNDGDYDALMGNDRYDAEGIIYFKNIGTATSPEFDSELPPAPFDDTDLFEGNPNVVSVDLDNDGDLDLAVTETYYNGWYGDSDAARTRFFENTGDGEFTEFDNPLIIELTPESITAFADIDGDGDLDAFVGNGYSFDNREDGTVFYFENTNPPPVTSVTQNSVSVAYNTPVRLDPNLSINDDDNDDIVQATVVISNFSEGNELLDFTPSAGVTGAFEDGVLTITGKATLEEYETILQSVTYEATSAVTSARQASGRAGLPPGKTVTFSVRDIDFTETVISVVSVITLDITGELGGIVVYNAVSPGVTANLNDYMRIDGLPSDNEVTIFNRWGDEVFKVSGYNNNSIRFEGKNDNGKELPSGTYFYIIEVNGQTITGYLSLKR